METKLNVKLLTYTKDLEEVIAVAGKLCYSPSSIGDLIEEQTEENTKKFVNMLTSMGHESPLEHCSFTFGIEGVSRSLTHQLVRHRIASYSQQSPRYVKEVEFEYIIPDEIKSNEYAKNLFIKQMEDLQHTYDELVKILQEEGKNEKQAIELARYVLTNACETKIICTMNLRSLINFTRHRCCRRAQGEIQKLAWTMIEEIEKVSPLLAKNLGASCQFGKCPEGNMSCGKPFVSKCKGENNETI